MMPTIGDGERRKYQVHQGRNQDGEQDSNHLFSSLNEAPLSPGADRYVPAADGEKRFRNRFRRG